MRLGRLVLATAVAVTGLVAGGTASASAGTAPASLVDRTITVSLVHGVPGVPVDLYVDDRLVLDDVAPLTVSAPLQVPTNGRNLYKAVLRPADGTAASRPLLQTYVLANPGLTVTLTAGLGATGTPTFGRITEITFPTENDRARLFFRHRAAAPAVDLVVDGVKVARSVPNGDGAYFGFQYGEDTSLRAGTYTVAVTAAGSDTPLVGPLTVTLPEGTETELYAVGALSEGTLGALVQQRTVGAFAG